MVFGEQLLKYVGGRPTNDMPLLVVEGDHIHVGGASPMTCPCGAFMVSNNGGGASHLPLTPAIGLRVLSLSGRSRWGGGVGLGLIPPFIDPWGPGLARRC